MTSSKSKTSKAPAARPNRAAPPVLKKATSKTSGVRSKPAPAAPATSKLEQITSLLQRPDGASLAELCKATGWQKHSVRGALAGALKRKGHAIISEKIDDVRRYRTAVQL